MSLNIVLTSADNQKIDLDFKSAERSQLLKDLLVNNKDNKEILYLHFDHCGCG